MPLSRRIFLSSALLLSSSGCRLLEDADSGIMLVPSVSSATLQVGDTVRVNTTVTNVGREAIELNAYSCNRHYDIIDSRGRVVGPVEPGGCYSIYVPLHLAPGESHVFEGFYTGAAFNELVDPIPGSNIYVPRGTYAVRARIGVPVLARTIVGRSVPLVVNNPRGFLPD